MQKILAVIDIGSLKAKFEIKTLDENLNGKTMYKEVVKTVLLKDLHKNGNIIIEQSIVDTINAIKHFQQKMQEFNVDDYKAITTEAFRKATNANDVLKRIDVETDITLEIIDGKHEGEILFKSISSDFKDENIAIVDVGSGSVQVVIGKNNEIYKSYSFTTGTYAWSFQPIDRRHPTIEESTKELKHVKDTLSPLEENKFDIKYIVYGTTCIIDFFKAMKFKEIRLKHKVHNFYVDISDLKDLYNKIISLHYEERSKFYPEDPYYMWGIDKAFMNIMTISEYLKANKIVPTNNNIASGILQEIAVSNF